MNRIRHLVQLHLVPVSIGYAFVLALLGDPAGALVLTVCGYAVVLASLSAALATGRLIEWVMDGPG